MKNFVGGLPGPLGRVGLLVATAMLGGVTGDAASAESVHSQWIPISVSAGHAARQTSADQFEVSVADTRRDVRQVLDSRSSIPWQVLIYFDAPLTSPDGLRQAARLLEGEAARLARLGPTAITVADPRPTSFLDPTRDETAIREALRDVREEARTSGELQWLRQRFSSARLAGEESGSVEAWQQERDLLDEQRRGLLSRTVDQAAAGPRLLILVQSGYDLNPRSFYTDSSAASFLEDPRDSLSTQRIAQALATEGWTVVCLSLGPRPAELVDPLAPLFLLAEATGGAVVTRRREITEQLREIAGWPILEVDLRDQAVPEPRPLAVRWTGDDRPLRTRRWIASAPMPEVVELRAQGPAALATPAVAVQIVRPEGLAFQGQIRLRAITGHGSVDRVAFLLDGTPIAESRRSPFNVVVDLGPGVVPHEITAVAYTRADRRLGEDTLLLNADLEPARATISGLDYDARQGILALVAEVSAPRGHGPELVEIFLNDRTLARLEAPPYRLQREVGELQPVDVVRVVASYASGDIAEAAALPAISGPADELDVNLVELLAMVTPRNRRSPIELDRSDFVIRRRGDTLPIDRFSRWDDTQLTLGLAFDTSDSMEEILVDARLAGERFFDEALRDGDEAFVVEFNNRPRLTRRLTTDSDELLHSLTGLEAHGMTALYDAIVFSLQQFEPAAGRRALVVVTDGVDSSSHFQPGECVRQARVHGVPIYLIVLGTPPDPHRDPELLRNRMVARRTGGEVYYITDLDDLGSIYDQILTELRHQYFLAFDAGHTLTPQELEEIEIDVERKGLSVRTLLASQHRGG